MRGIANGGYTFLEAGQEEFQLMKKQLITGLLHTTPINRGKWQSEDVSTSDSHSTHELPNVTLVYGMPVGMRFAQRAIQPDLPWAEHHFQERVSGKPLNPAPSYVYWPYHSRAEAERHVKEGVFAHTYPERMWPKHAMGPRYPLYHHINDACVQEWGKNRGIRFNYGDLGDVVKQLIDDPFTRQAYLPIFFPEDTGATEGQRVPCTLGYHFIRRGAALDCYYAIRSCDIYRHFTNDVYMAVRLTQWVVDQLVTASQGVHPWVGNMNMTISNLHLFKGDVWRINQ